MAYNREILGKGLKFPFRFGGDSFSHDGPEQSKYERHIIEGLQQLVLVQRKSRRFNRAFGSRLFELSFEVLTKSPGLAARFIEDVIIQEPRATLKSINTAINANRSQVEVRVDIDFTNSPRSGSLVFPFYSGSNGRPTLAEVRVNLE